MGTPQSKSHVAFKNMAKDNIDFPAIAALAAEKVAAGKAPSAVINELGVNIKNQLFGKSGKPHCPIFKYEIILGHLRFVGKGSSKRAARAKAAQQCVDELLLMNMSLQSSIMAATVPSAVEAPGSATAGAVATDNVVASCYRHK